LLRSRSTDGGCAGTEKKLVEKDKSGTIGDSTIRQGDESNRPPSVDKKTTSLLLFQEDFGAVLEEGRNGERVGNKANE